MLLGKIYDSAIKAIKAIKAILFHCVARAEYLPTL
jgi:hypothetical protein